MCLWSVRVEDISETTRLNFAKFSRILPTAMARLSSGSVVVSCVLPVLWMTSCFRIMRRYDGSSVTAVSCTVYSPCCVLGRAEIARHASRGTMPPPKYKTPHASIPHWSNSSAEFLWITGYYGLGRLPHAGSQDTDLYPAMCQFPRSVALCDHSPQTLRTDGRTDRRHARSTSENTVEVC